MMQKAFGDYQKLIGFWIAGEGSRLIVWGTYFRFYCCKTHEVRISSLTLTCCFPCSHEKSDPRLKLLYLYIFFFFFGSCFPGTFLSIQSGKERWNARNTSWIHDGSSPSCVKDLSAVHNVQRWWTTPGTEREVSRSRHVPEYHSSLDLPELGRQIEDARSLS